MKSAFKARPAEATEYGAATWQLQHLKLVVRLCAVCSSSVNANVSGFSYLSESETSKSRHGNRKGKGKLLMRLTSLARKKLSIRLRPDDFSLGGAGLVVFSNGGRKNSLKERADSKFMHEFYLDSDSDSDAT